MRNAMTDRLLWEVECKPIYVPGQENIASKALVRSDNGKLLGIRSKHYYPVFNRDLEAIKERILSTDAFNFKGHQEFQGGKRILSFYENKRDNLKICGEDVKDYLIIGNSNDASSKLFVGTSSYMFRCENQFSEKIRAYERRHDRPFNIHEIRIEEIIETYELGRKDLYGKMEQLQSIEANMEIIHALAVKLLKTETRTDRIGTSEMIKNTPQHVQFLKCIETEIKDLGPTLWGVFNGVTRYTSNHLKGNPGFGVVNGLGERMNREAMSFLEKI